MGSSVSVAMVAPAVISIDSLSLHSKWQADRHGVKCICCHGNRGLVVTAGRTIKFWSSTDYTLVKVSLLSH